MIRIEPIKISFTCSDEFVFLYLFYLNYITLSDLKVSYVLDHALKKYKCFHEKLPSHPKIPPHPRQPQKKANWALAKRFPNIVMVTTD
jgi:hypothetical protein